LLETIAIPGFREQADSLAGRRLAVNKRRVGIRVKSLYETAKENVNQEDAERAVFGSRRFSSSRRCLSQFEVYHKGRLMRRRVLVTVVDVLPDGSKTFTISDPATQSSAMGLGARVDTTSGGQK
jgi:arginyl-tRNA--protein-N-Asp/Glu arginylyltransferase